MKMRLLNKMRLVKAVVSSWQAGDLHPKKMCLEKKFDVKSPAWHEETTGLTKRILLTCRKYENATS